jgi:hypothetical protein
MNLTEKNKLIAEFMGMEHCYRPYGDGFMEVKENGSCVELEDLQYHKSWDWLMPVLKKINLEINPYCRGAWRMITHCVEYRIEDVHSQVVEFIKEYNENERLNKEYISYNDAPYGQD